jgi:hypothetical protein
MNNKFCRQVSGSSNNSFTRFATSPAGNDLFTIFQYSWPACTMNGAINTTAAK